MIRQKIMLPAFNAGFWAEIMDGRMDLGEIYARSCRQLDNFIPLVQGPVRRRSGTRYVGTGKTSGKQIRLITFKFSTEQAYVIELGDSYMRFYRDRGRIVDGTDLITNGDFASDIADWDDISSSGSSISHDAVNNRMSLTSDGVGDAHAEQDVAITTTGQVHILTFTVYDGPIDLQIGTATGTHDTMSATTYQAGTHEVEFTPTANPSYVQFLHGDAATYGIDDVTCYLSYYEVASPYGESDLFDVDYAQAGDTMYLTHPSYALRKLVRSGDASWTLSAPTLTLGDPIADLNASADNYPSVVTFYQQRLILGNTNNYPQTFWGSVPGEAEDFTGGTADDDAFEFTVVSNEANEILWFLNYRALSIGTTGGIWQAAGQGANAPITPTSIVVSQDMALGASSVRGELVESAVVFAQREGLRVFEVTYSLLSDSYSAKDVSQAAASLIEGGIVQMGYQQLPETRVWFVAADGSLTCLTYAREEKVAAWSNHPTDGEYESVVVIPGANRDEVWVSVKRTIGGTDYRFIEYIDDDQGDEIRDAHYVDSGLVYDESTSITGASLSVTKVVVTATDHGIEDGDSIYFLNVGGMTDLNYNTYVAADRTVDTVTLKDSHGNYVDGSSFGTYTSGGRIYPLTESVTNLDHLEGESVALLTDGSPHPAVTVSSGTVALNRPAAIVHAGLPFTSTLKTCRVAASDNNGPAQGVVKSISKAVLRLRHTVGGEVTASGSANGTKLVMATTTDPYGQPVDMFTGDKAVDIDVAMSREGSLTVVQDDPLPIEVISMTLDVEVGSM